MSPTVECCLRNVPAEFRALVRDDAGTASGADDLRFREAPCKEHCGICLELAFLIVDGDVRTGPTHRDVLESVDGVSIPDVTGSNGGPADSDDGATTDTPAEAERR